MSNKAKNKLFQLIQSLSKSEKRYFKVMSKKSGPQNKKNYLQLFDIIEQLKVYDETEVIRQMKSANLKISYLSSDMNYLLNLILESQRNFHSDSSSRIKVNNYLTDVELLFNKGLLKLAMNRLRKAKKISLEEDILSYRPEILRWERKLIGNDYKSVGIDDQYLEFKSALKELEDFNEYDFLYRKSNLIRTQVLSKARNKSTMPAYDEVMKHPLMLQQKPTSFYSQFRYLQTLAIFNYSNDKLPLEYQNNIDLISLMNSKPNFKKEYPVDYLSIYSRVLILSKRIAPERYFEILTDYLNFAETTKKDGRKVRAQGYSLAYGTELVRLINEESFEEGEQLSQKVSKVMKDYGDLINPAIKVNNYYKFAYIFIRLKKYSQALDNINIILNKFEERHRPDIFSYSKILALLIHFEIGNFQILPYLTQSTILHFRNRKKLFNSEALLLQFFKKSAEAHHTRTLPDAFRRLESNLTDILKNPKEQYILQYFDFMWWVKDKVNSNDK